MLEMTSMRSSDFSGACFTMEGIGENKFEGSVISSILWTLDYHLFLLGKASRSAISTYELSW